jgi:hypothetical protein
MDNQMPSSALLWPRILKPPARPSMSWLRGEKQAA